MDKGKWGGPQNWIKKILNIININFAILEQGQRGGGVKTHITFLVDQIQLFYNVDPSLTCLQ